MELWGQIKWGGVVGVPGVETEHCTLQGTTSRQERRGPVGEWRRGTQGGGREVEGGCLGSQGRKDFRSEWVARRVPGVQRRERGLKPNPCGKGVGRASCWTTQPT